MRKEPVHILGWCNNCLNRKALLLKQGKEALDRIAQEVAASGRAQAGAKLREASPEEALSPCCNSQKPHLSCTNVNAASGAICSM